MAKKEPAKKTTRVRTKVAKKTTSKPTTKKVSRVSKPPRPKTPPKSMFNHSPQSHLKAIGILLGVLLTSAIVLSVFNLLQNNKNSEETSKIEGLQNKISLMELVLNKNPETSLSLDIAKPSDNDLYINKDSNRFQIINYLSSTCGESCLKAFRENNDLLKQNYDILVRNTNDKDSDYEIICSKNIEELYSIIAKTKDVETDQNCSDNYSIKEKVLQNKNEFLRLNQSTDYLIAIYDLETKNAIILNGFDNLEDAIKDFESSL